MEMIKCRGFVFAAMVVAWGVDVETSRAPEILEDLQARIDAVAVAGGGRVNVCGSRTAGSRLSEMTSCRDTGVTVPPTGTVSAVRNLMVRGPYYYEGNTCNHPVG